MPLSKLSSFFSSSDPRVAGNSSLASRRVRHVVSGLLASLATVAAAQVATTATMPKRTLAVPFPATPTPTPAATPLSPEGLTNLVFPREVSPESPTAMSILYSGTRRAQTDPCGCHAKQLGGIEREARVDQEIESKGLPLLRIDAGGFYKEYMTDADKTRGLALLKSLGILKYDALNVGYPDLALGVDVVKKDASAAGLKLISANVTDKDGKPLFEDSIVVPVKLRSGQTVRFGITGVSRPRGTPGVPAIPGSAANAPATYSIADPVEALKKELPELKAKSDFIVLLDYDRREHVVDLLGKLGPLGKDITLAVAAEYNPTQTAVQKQGDTMIVSGAYEGKNIGHLMLDIAGTSITATAHRWIDVEQTIPPVPEIQKIAEDARHAITASNAGKPATPGFTVTPISSVLKTPSPLPSAAAAAASPAGGAPMGAHAPILPTSSRSSTSQTSTTLN